MKPRLFIFGDSFVDWDVPKYHWTYYLTHHYDVQKYGKLGADNYSILFQLGNLPEYQDGDRIIIFFTEPGRLPRRFYGERREKYKDTPYIAPQFFKDVDFGTKLHGLKYDEGERWVDGTRNIEVSFLKNLKLWLSNYSPIYLTWSEYFHKPTSEFTTLIQVSSNYSEGYLDDRDFHPGPKGCYEVYKTCHKLLNINEDVFPFKEEEKELI